MTDDRVGNAARTRALMLAAGAAEREGRLDEAETLYHTLLAVDGEDFEGLLRLGTLKIAKGQPDEGELLIRQCAARGATSSAAHAMLAAAFLALRHPDDAITQGRQAVALDPDHVTAHFNLGSAFQALQRHGEAVASYQRALAIDPDLLAAHFNLATALQALNRHAEAIASYERALAADPDVVEALYGIGVALNAQGCAAESIARFERALAIDPEFAEAATALGQTLQSLGRDEDAISRYEQALDIDPDYVEARAGLGTALQALSRHPEAIACFEAVLAAEPDNPIVTHLLRSYNAYGQERVAAKRYEEACGCFERALALRPNDANAHANYAVALSSADRVEEAVDAYRRAVSLDPSHPQIHINFGTALVLTGRGEEARRVFEQATTLAPLNAEPFLALAGLHRMKPGDPTLQAMERLAAMLEGQAGSDEMKLRFALGKAYEDIGDHERSFRHFIAGNALKRRTLSYDEAKTMRSHEQVRHIFTAEFLRSKAGSGGPSTAPIFILGYPRSGSTLMEQMLSSHPRVFGAGERSDFVDAVTIHCPQLRDASSLSGEALHRLGAHYVAGLARSAPDAARVTDKLLGNYLYLGFIRLALPNARIIHTCRDPVDTCLSCFSTLFGGDTTAFSYDLGELGRHYRAYAELMEHWRRVLPAGAMLEVRYEDLVANFEQEARRIVAYCGLPWDDACLAFHKTKRIVRTASAVQVRQPIYQSSVGRARPVGDMLKPLLDALGLGPLAPPGPNL